MKNRIFFIIGIFILTSVILLSYNIFIESKDQIVKEFENHQLYIANDITDDLNSDLVYLAKNSQTLFANNKNINLKEIFKDNLFLKEQFLPYIQSISFYDLNGKLLSSNSSDIDEIDKTEIDKMLSGNYSFVIDDDERVLETDGSIDNFKVYVPLKSINAIMAYQVHASEFFKSKIINRNLDRQKFGLWVIDKEGNVLFQSDHPKMESKNLNQMNKDCLKCHKDINYIQQILKENKGHLKYSIKELNERNASFSTMSINNEEWKIVVTTPSDEVTKFLTKAAHQTIILFVLVLVVILLIAFVIIRLFKKHIKAGEDLKHITEKNLLLNKLVETEGKYKELFDINPLPMWVYSLDNLKFVTVNDAAVKHYGYSRDEFLSMNLKDIRPEEEIPVLEKILSKPRHNFEVYADFVKHKKKDGTIIEVDLVSQAFSGPEENLRLVVAKDITKEFLLTKELKESESRFRDIADLLPQTIFETDRSGILTYINETGKKTFGITDQEIDNKSYNVIQLVKKEDRIRVIRKFKRSLKGIMDIRSEYTLQKRDGSLIPITIFKNLILRNKEIIGFRGLLIDMSEMKEAIDSIKLLAHAISSIKECVSITDKNENLIFVNDSFLSTYGYSREEIIGKHISVLRPSEITNGIDKKISTKTMEGGWQGEVLNCRKDGTIFPISLSTSLIKDEDSNPIASVGIAIDITETKRAHRELIAAKEKAEEMNRLKSSFLANMSHELRTPMIGMLGFSEILKDELDNPDHIKMADEIYNSGQRLMQTLNMVLDLSRIEANKTEINFREVNIKDIILASAKLFEPVAANKKLYLKYNFASEKIYAHLDESLIVRIMNNLLTNALKFTKEGGITIDVDLENINCEKFVNIKVMDTGIGIPNEYQQVIFEEFRQVSEGLGRNYEGTGLGLTITKKSVEMMNGSISVISEVDKGSEFIIRFPAIVKEEINIKSIPMNNEPGHIEIKPENNLPKVLLVENDKTSANITQMTLKNVCNLDWAEEGEKAIELALSNQYSMILMDIGLGFGMNGIEVTHIIRNIPGYEKTPVVALTAFAMKDDKSYFLSEGLTHYLSKPFRIIDLKNMVLEILKSVSVENSSES